MIFADTKEDFKTMLIELTSGTISLKVNLKKIKIMCPENPEITIRGIHIENVTTYK